MCISATDWNGETRPQKAAGREVTEGGWQVLPGFVESEGHGFVQVGMPNGQEDLWFWNSGKCSELEMEI